jgi:hypothetical protein
LKAKRGSRYILRKLIQERAKGRKKLEYNAYYQ